MPHVTLRRAAIALALFFPAGIAWAAGPASLPHQAYVWQRAWTPQVGTALEQTADLFAGYRVLVAEADAHGRLLQANINWAALDRTRRPITLVIRIDGQLRSGTSAAMVARIGALASAWRGHRVTGLEIDHDCGTARLESYARFLRDLRKVPGVPARLSITALPTWLTSPVFDKVAAAVDELVLQVHAVQAPSAGLFDARSARAWVNSLVRHRPKDFWIAVPDYGTRIVRAENGSLLAVESEEPRLIGGVSATELIATPVEVSAFIQDLQHAPPPGLSGIVWFRLPVAGDRRMWSLSTLRNVIRGQPLSGRLDVVARPAGVAGVVNVVLTNESDTDLPLPGAVELPAPCRLADGVNGYALDGSGRNISLRRLQNALLPAHHEQVIGWARCSPAPGGFHVRP